MANNEKENKIKKFTKEAIGKTLNQFNKEIGIADLVEINKNQDRILNGILSQVNDENTEKTEKSNIITLDNSTDGIVELKEIQGDTNVNVSKIEEMPITHDIGDKEGNVFTLNEITKGAISIGEIQGNTMVNCNKEPDKEIILNGNINTEGYSNVTLTEGVDGGLVDVALEGNTMVNVCDQKDPVAITSDSNTFTLKYLYTSTDYIIQFESDTEIVIDITLGGTTLLSQNIIVGINKINITTSSELIDNNLVLNGEGFNASNIVVTKATGQDFGYFEGMKSVGECEDLEVVSCNSDGTLSNTQTLTHEPLRAVADIKDKYVLIDGKWYIERNCGVRAYQEGDIDNYITDKINTVYPLSTPTYEPINYNPFTVYSGTTHISNNSTIPCNMTIKNTGYNCLLKPNTTYTVSSNLGLNTVTTPSTLTEDCLRFYDTDTSDVTTMKDVLVLEGDYTTGKPIPTHFSGIESAFEQEYDTEKGKYKVNIKVANEDKTKESNITFYIDEPLRGIGDAKDKVYVKNDKVVVERNCGSVTLDGTWYDDGNGVHGKKIYSNIKLPYLPYVDPYNCVNFISEDVFDSKEPSASNIPLYGMRLRYASNSYYQNVTIPNGISNINDYMKNLTIVYQLASPTYEEVDYSESRLLLDTYNNSTLFYESNIPVSNTSFKPLWEELVYLKNSTKYYIQFNSTASGTVVFNLGGTEVTKDIVEGYNNIAIDTPAETTNLLTIDGHGIKISEVVVSESVCGGHYLGLQSCFEEHMENGKYRVLLRGIALDGSKVNGIKLYLDEPLRGIGDVKDRLCIKDGKLMVERKCGEVVFDGSEDENIAYSNTYDRIIFIGINVNNTNTKVISNNGLCGIFTWNSVYRIGIRNISQQGITSLDIAKVWLQQNPTTIVYQLASPTYEEATNEYGLPIVFEGYENGIVYIDSAVTPTTHIKYTSNNQLATTLAEAEEQNITTQEDINMNVITYMMDIDMMLTDMEMSNDISVMAVRRDSSNENMLDRMSDEDKKVYRDNTVVMLEKMITAKALEKEDIERRIDMYYNKNRISKEQYKYLKSLL